MASEWIPEMPNGVFLMTVTGSHLGASDDTGGCFPLWVPIGEWMQDHKNSRGPRWAAATDGDKGKTSGYDAGMKQDRRSGGERNASEDRTKKGQK